MGDDGRHLVTVLGWSPGVSRLLGGTVLECGCLAGRYELRGGLTVTVIDHHGAACTRAGHVPNACLADDGVWLPPTHAPTGRPRGTARDR